MTDRKGSDCGARSERWQMTGIVQTPNAGVTAVQGTDWQVVGQHQAPQQPASRKFGSAPRGWAVLCWRLSGQPAQRGHSPVTPGGNHSWTSMSLLYASRRSVFGKNRKSLAHTSRGVIAGTSIRSIVASLGRAPSTISRELRRHSGPEGLSSQSPLKRDPSPR